MAVLVSAPPCLVYEDEHLLVVNKPAGLNTHSPSPFAGEGLHEWLKNREPRWANLAIVHRLDKVTSGLIVFAKSKAANQSLTQQFATRGVTKKYLLRAASVPPAKKFTVRSLIARLGEKYIASDKAGEPAETSFEVVSESKEGAVIAAFPLTGRTHQIRVHAAHRGFPILGDSLYGGAAFPRVCLHAAELSFSHPATGAPLHFEAPVDFAKSVAMSLREALINPAMTNAFRIDHGETAEGVCVEQWSDWLLVESEKEPDSFPAWRGGIYFKTLNRQVQKSTLEQASPRHVSGPLAPDPFMVLENGVQFEISFNQGYSTGLFLDQRENRRRLLIRYVAPGFDLPAGEVLNTFAYTCGFSVCAAMGGAHCTSLDLSRKYLEWGQRNFRLNGLEPGAHDFIFGDVFDWVPRFHKKGRQFDVIILDPPTFSRSKFGGTFQAERDYARLVKLVLPILKRGGTLFASTNAHKLAPEQFRAQVLEGIQGAGRGALKEQYMPQPFDFPISKSQPAYLKTIWFRVA